VAPILPADPAPLVQRLIALVSRRGSGESTRLMHASGLSFPQILTLFALRRSSASVTELAARLRLSLPATSQLVERLVEAGLVARAELAGDRRVRRISIRPPGLRFLERFAELRMREIEEALRSLSPATRQALAAALTAAVAELDREPEAGGEPPIPARRPRRTRSGT
jgi:MarR family transcriptional regulator, organic hydroperoxide resistance regulator